MSPTPYLVDIATRLGRGMERLPESFRRRQADWLTSRQRRDGGFAGRQGASNLYYTGFAMRLGQLLDVRSLEFWENSAEYLRLKAPEPRDMPDVLVRLMARPMLQLRGVSLWTDAADPKEVAVCRTLMDQSRRCDGFARRPSDSLSVFQTFHAALCYELLGEPMPASPKVGAAIRRRQRTDGGFVDMPESADESGTNPTAAAVGTLKAIDELHEKTGARAAGFIRAMQRPDGGFAAHARSPMSDLMTTFTALTTLGDSSTLRGARLGDAGRYIQSLVMPEGGFLAAPGDDEADIEYTYYGVGALALLAAETAKEHF